MRRLRIDADLSFSVTAAGEGPGGVRSARGTVRAAGSTITVQADDLHALAGAADRRATARIAGELASRGLTLSVSGPSGGVVTIGAVRSPLLHRFLTRSRHIRVDGWRAAWELSRAQRKGGATTGGLVGRPPTTPWPPAPTFRRLRRRVTTTHDPLGGGRPQLVLATGPGATRDHRRKVFRLPPAVTTIGSAPDADLRLGGLAARHAEIRRDDADEYVLVPVDADALTLVNGTSAARHVLRSGARIQLGGWRMSYWREEYADHGRPHGGRDGGELSHQRHQSTPAYRPPQAKG